MDNIAFILWIFCIFGSLTAVFACAPLLWRKNMVFGVLAEEDVKKRADIRKFTVFYVVYSAACGCTCAITSILLRSVLLSSVLAAADVLLELLCYHTIKKEVLRLTGVRRPAELVLREFPVSVLPKCLHAGWYAFFALPVLCSAVIGKYSGGTGAKTALLLEAGICAVSLLLRRVIAHMGHYTRGDVLQSIQQNAIYRRTWSILNFVICLLLAWLVAALHLVQCGLVDAAPFLLFAPAAAVPLITAGLILFSIFFGRKN